MGGGAPKPSTPKPSTPKPKPKPPPPPSREQPLHISDGLVQAILTSKAIGYNGRKLFAPKPAPPDRIQKLYTYSHSLANGDGWTTACFHLYILSTSKGNPQPKPKPRPKPPPDGT
ncbi:hypothetical protein LTR05_000500 [Lithohypha guttulata]|uniref:Uncharacterized protein n=1 Tax=Lithohypha guttulata TaxID=1690604 RepID=A0AAN7T4L7_9EURO|nr:hypothetical protein LTR05_000500 [Lithohypha guttulata]